MKHLQHLHFSISHSPRVPVFREYLLGLGVNSVSKASINGNLTRGPGASVMIVIGGPREGFGGRKSDGRCFGNLWGYPNSWMVYSGKSMEIPFQ